MGKHDRSKIRDRRKSRQRKKEAEKKRADAVRKERQQQG